VLNLDIVDVSGELQRHISHSVLKVRLDKDGKQVPNSYSAEMRSDLDKMVWSLKKDVAILARMFA
jgi:hypothetical protein